MAGTQLKIRKSSIWILWLFLAVMFSIAALASFDIIDLSAQTTAIMTLFGALFILAEIGWFSAVRGKSIIRILGLIVALIAGIGAVLNLFGLVIEMLEPIQGVVAVLLVIYVFIVAFTK